MKPEDHQAQKRAQLLRNIAQERIIELREKLRKAHERDDKKQVRFLAEAIKVNERMLQ
jgi:hypothetical protein